MPHQQKHAQARMAADTVNLGIFMALWICKWLAYVILGLKDVFMESGFVIGL